MNLFIVQTELKWVEDVKPIPTKKEYRVSLSRQTSGIYKKLEIGNWKLEIGNWKLEIGNWKLEIGNLGWFSVVGLGNTGHQEG
jgi:hypothetical protein